MKKEKKVYLLIEWPHDTFAEYTKYDNRTEAYFNRPYFKTLAKARKVYGFYWCGNDWPHCEIMTFASYDDYENGKDPITWKTYYK